MSGHTPGPWKVYCAKRPDNTGGYDWAITDQDYQIIAETYEHTGYEGGTDRQYIIQPAEANTRLIAAAPDLLETLKAVLAAYEGPSNDWRDRVALQMHNVRAAIAKATGAA